jgi:hypothetical protein
MKRNILALILAASMILAGCGSSNSQSTVAPTASPVPTATPEPTEAPKVETNDGFTATKTTHVDITDPGLQALADKYSAAVADLTDAYDALPKEFSSFEDLKDNEDAIYAWFEHEREISEKLFEDTKAACSAYYTNLEATTTDAEFLYNNCDEANEIVYNTLLDYYNDAVYEGLYDEMNKTYYEGAYDSVKDTADDYGEWLSSASNFYSEWLDSASDLYSDWLDTGSDVYKEYLDKSSDYYSAYLNNKPYSASEASD